MKIIKLKGGLGNQLFQYAFAKEMEALTHDTVLLDFSNFENSFNDHIRQPRIMKFNLSLYKATREQLNNVCLLNHKENNLTYWYKIKIILEIIFNFKRYFFERNTKYIPSNQLMFYKYFDGYWQSWRHVDSVFDKIKQDFLPNYELSEKTKILINQLQNENSVFVGVRRGDYAKECAKYGNFNEEYYLKAMDYIEKRIKNPTYYIFSNDIEWVKKNLDFGLRNIKYREKDDIIDDFEELIIMSNCKHSIIINSTYHWWGARLNYYKDKIVIGPKRWFFDNEPIDIMPPYWIKI